MSTAQKARYGQFSGEPTGAQLDRYFHLDDFDRVCIRRHCRGDENRLGFAAQLASIRFLGALPSDPGAIPRGALGYLSRQLEIYGRPKLLKYGSSAAHWRHSEIIRAAYGYKVFGQMPLSLGFLRWMYSRVWACEEKPGVLFDLATAWLVERKILLPGVTTLLRVISRVRERVATQMVKRRSGLLSEQ